MTITIPLSENEIHLWTIDPKQVKLTQGLQGLLSHAESEKVDRYRNDTAKHTALITRIFIRLLLSEYATLLPADWQFTISKLGKPELYQAPLPLRFNLSHNDELIVCALCLDKDIGCDIENRFRTVNVNAIVKRFFSRQEAQRIIAAPTRFFEYWTLKEAFVKATGLGISQGLDTFSFEVKEAHTSHFNDNINLSFVPKEELTSKQQSPEDCYQALLFPDDKHCIGLSVHGQQNSDNKPTIRLISDQKSKQLFDSY